MAPKRNYECAQCKQTFTNKMKLQTHLKIHAEEEKLESQKKISNALSTIKNQLSKPKETEKNATEKENEELSEDKEVVVVENNTPSTSGNTQNASKEVLSPEMREKITDKVQSCLEDCRNTPNPKPQTSRNIDLEEALAVLREEFGSDFVKIMEERFSSKNSSGEQSKKDNENVLESDTCFECGIKFSDQNLLLQHLATHTDFKIYQCDVCKKKFTRKYHLLRHTQMTSCSGQPPPAHPCQVCGKVYTRKDNLREHLRAHAGKPRQNSRKKRFNCTHCGKSFQSRSLLQIHIRSHTGEKPFHCEFCPKSFPSVVALTIHRRVHTGEKPYECTHCGDRFSLKGSLNRHTRTHTGVRPHTCQYCGKQFIQPGGLKAHMFFHTGQNGFKCETCGKVFNRKARLHLHISYVHEKIKPFVCSDCGKKFTRKEDLYRHYTLHSGEKPFECPTCLKKFPVKSSLKLHLLTHTKEEPRSCHECGRAFIRKDCLLRHMRKWHRNLLDKIFVEEKDKKVNKGEESAPVVPQSRLMSEDLLCQSIRELLSLLVDSPTLISFGWPDKPVDELLEAVIRRCGHTPVNAEDYSYMDRLRENSKLLFTVVIDDNAVKTLLNNQTVDEVILHVLRLAQS